MTTLQDAMVMAQNYADRALGWTQTIEDALDEQFVRAVYTRFSNLAQTIVVAAGAMSVDDAFGFSYNLDDASTEDVYTRLRHALHQVQQAAEQDQPGNAYYSALHVVYAASILLQRSYAEDDDE